MGCVANDQEARGSNFAARTRKKSKSRSAKKKKKKSNADDSHDGNNGLNSIASFTLGFVHARTTLPCEWLASDHEQRGRPAEGRPPLTTCARKCVFE